MMSQQEQFRERLFDVASAIGRKHGKNKLDVTSLWQAFVHLACNDHEEAASALKENLGERDWTAHAPDEIPSTTGSDKLPSAQEVKRLFTGPLSILNKKYEGELSPMNFLAVLHRAEALDKLLGEAGTVSSAVHTSQDANEISEPAQQAADHQHGHSSPESPAPATSASEANEPSVSHASQSASDKAQKKLAEALDDLQDKLEDSVYGQASAVRTFVDGLRTSLGQPTTPNKLRGAFLMFGPNGCGKGELIRTLEAWTEENKDILPLKNTISCEGYLQNALPALRDRVRNSDPGFLVLSEFERYEAEFRDILLDGMDRAVLQLPDRSIGGKVIPTDIHGWIIILIGNVGRRFWKRMPFKEKEMLPDSERIREVLAREALSDPHQKSDIFQTRLNRAFLDRIDAFIPFCQLRYADVAAIFDREIEELRTELAGRDKTLNVEQPVRDLVVLNSYYKRNSSGRQALHGFKEHIENPVRNALQQYQVNTLSLTCQDEALNEALGQSTPEILVIDDQCEKLCADLREGLQATAQVTGATDIKQALELAQEKSFDLVLLDLYFNGQALWKEYLEQWRSAQRETPVVLFAGKRMSPQDRVAIDQMGGVLGIMEKQSQPENYPEILHPFLNHAAWRAKIRYFEDRLGHAGDLILFEQQIHQSNDGVEISVSDVQNVVSEGQIKDEKSPVLPAQTRRDIDEFLDLFLNSRKRAELRINKPSGLLLYGPPGNGKTMIARDLANRMRCSFFSLSSSELESSLAGVASNRLQEFFEKARRRQPCVLFIDELDAVAPTRKEDTGGGVLRNQAATVSTLLTEMDGFGEDAEVFVIGATNRKEAIDPALLRPGRLDRVIRVPQPGVHERRTLLEETVEGIPHSFDTDWAAREAFGLSCAHVVQAVQDSVLNALRREENNDVNDAQAITLTQEDFREAVDRLRHGESFQEDSPEAQALKANRKSIAWHEAGHLLLTMVLRGEIPERVSIVPRGEQAGFVRESEEAVARRTIGQRRSDCITEMAILLAGGIAEEKAFDEHTAGVSDDRARAMDLAYNMIARWGMGPVEAEISAFLGTKDRSQDHRHDDESPPAGDQTAVYQAMTDLVKEAEELASKQLDEHYSNLSTAAELLLDEEELDRPRIEEEFPAIAPQPTEKDQTQN